MVRRRAQALRPAGGLDVRRPRAAAQRVAAGAVQPEGLPHRGDADVRARAQAAAGRDALRHRRHRAQPRPGAWGGARAVPPAPARGRGPATAPQRASARVRRAGGARAARTNAHTPRPARPPARWWSPRRWGATCTASCWRARAGTARRAACATARPASCTSPCPSSRRGGAAAWRRGGAGTAGAAPALSDCAVCANAAPHAPSRPAAASPHRHNVSPGAPGDGGRVRPGGLLRVPRVHQHAARQRVLPRREQLHAAQRRRAAAQVGARQRGAAAAGRPRIGGRRARRGAGGGPGLRRGCKDCPGDRCGHRLRVEARCRPAAAPFVRQQRLQTLHAARAREPAKSGALSGWGGARVAARPPAAAAGQLGDMLERARARAREASRDGKHAPRLSAGAAEGVHIHTPPARGGGLRNNGTHNITIINHGFARRPRRLP